MLAPASLHRASLARDAGAPLRALLLALLVTACAPDRAALEIQLITDYAPGRDFDTISSAVDAISDARSMPAATDRSYGRAIRVARFEDLTPGRARVTVSLSVRGRIVQSQPRITQLRTGQTSIVTVSITRDCEGVVCPIDSPSAIACLGGVCVDPECSPDRPDLCPGACAPACVGSSIACVDRVCRPEGACVDETDDSRCAAGQICVADEGCRAPFTGPPADGGTDAGLPDVGTDVGTDAGPIGAPRPISPLSTATTTSRRPTFRWELGPNGDGARLELCADRACTSVLDTIDATGTSAAPSADLAPGIVFFRLFGRMGTTTGTSASATWEVSIGARTAPTDTSWGTSFDANGDGYADLAVGADGAGAGGEAYVYLGGPAGLPTSPNVTLASPDPGALFGLAIASAGDLNGDGYPELAVGGYTAAGSGRVYVYAGGASGIAATPTTTLSAPGGGSFGYALSSAGDVDGDGYCDLVVGAIAAGSGTAYVYAGGPTGVASTPTTTLVGPDGGVFGCAVGAGDVNADGYADVAIGAGQVSSNTGSAYVYLGGPTGVPTSPTTTLVGPSGVGGAFGFSVPCDADVNGDGYSDLAVGAEGAASVYVYPGSAGGIGSTPTYTVVGPDAGFFGRPAASAGDLNGDGYGDLAVGARSAFSDTGAGYAYYGGPTGIPTAPSVTLPAPDPPLSYFGAAVSSPGDVDGDGIADLVIGAWGAASTGRAYVYPGSAGGIVTTPAVTLSGPGGANGEFGVSVTSASDVMCVEDALAG